MVCSSMTRWVTGPGTIDDEMSEPEEIKGVGSEPRGKKIFDPLIDPGGGWS